MTRLSQRSPIGANPSEGIRMAIRIGPTVNRWSLLGWALALTGLGVAELVILTWALTALSLAVVWIGLPLFVSAVLFIRSIADRRRIWAGTTMGVIIGRRYLPVPGHGWVARFRAVGRDPGTWRDIRWLLVDSTLGLTLCLTVVALFVAGALGVIMPAIWTQLPAGAALDFPLGLRVTSVATALYIGVPNGVLYLAAWWWATPWLIRWYAQLTAALLNPDERARLSDRVEELASSRAQTVDQQAAELRRIERDLHDGTQAHLVALGMSLGLAEHLLSDDPRARGLLAEARQHNTEAIAELRALIRGIRPPVLSDRGLNGAVQALAIRIPLDIQVDIDVDGRMPEPIESAAYFSISEILTNTVKHARANRAWVRGHCADDRLHLVIGDNGRGGAALTEDGGLRGIRQRLAAFDGTVTVESPPGGGTTVTIELPCELSTAPPAPSDAPPVPPGR